MYVVVKNLNIRYKYFYRIKSENLRLPELHRKTKHSSNSKAKHSSNSKTKHSSNSKTKHSSNSKTKHSSNSKTKHSSNSKTKHSSNSKSYKCSIRTKFVFFYYTISITKDNGFLSFELYVVKCVYMLHIFYFVVVTSC
jgi:hypothetical protein